MLLLLNNFLMPRRLGFGVELGANKVNDSLDGRTPAVIPIKVRFVQVSSLAFGRSPIFDAQSGLEVQAMSLKGQGLVGQALWGFFVHQLGHARRTPMGIESGHCDRSQV